MQKLLLLDGNSMLFRAYYATLYGSSIDGVPSAMSTSNGIPTNAIFGFVMMLNKVIDLIQPDASLVAWDADSQTFRKEEYPAYKGTRKPLDEELIVQFPIVREFLDAAGIRRYEVHGYEADDIIGTMSKLSSEEIQTTILTSDRDLLQLVDENCRVLLMKKGITDMELMDVANFQTKYNGLQPLQIIDLKGLMGDSSDNIPGVKGVGEKTAMKLLSTYPSVEEVYEHIDEVKGKLKEKLEKDKDQAFLSKHLATIYREVPLPFTLEECAFHGLQESVNDFYAKYEMRSMIKHNTEVKVDYAYKEISTWDIQSEILLPVCTNAPYLSQELFGFMGISERTVYYISKENALMDLAFQTMLTQENTFMTWDVKEMMHLLVANGFSQCTFKEDLHIAAFLTHSQATNIDALVEALGIQLPETFHDLTLKSKEEAANSFSRVHRHTKAFIAQLWDKKDAIFQQLKEEGSFDLYETIEKPLIPILFQMEQEGIHIDASVLAKLNEKVDEEIQKLTQQIYAYANKEFNINSPKQLAVVLFDDLKLKKAGKKRSTSADVLEKLRSEHPIVDCLLAYRKYAKIKGTYIDGLKKHIQSDSKIHTSFNQTMTQTGRLSSSDPNLQNISVRDKEGREIRKAFTAEEGTVILSADYSQIELRMLAHMANETHMIEAFNADEDIHTRTATLIFNCKKEEVTPEQRRAAKTVNFGIVYGQTEFGLASQLGVSRMEAKEFMNAYFSKYANIHTYMNQLIDYCSEHGYVETLFHRRRMIPEIHNKNFMTREFGKRAAMNAPIQGSAADLIKIAMIQVDQAMKKANVKSKMLLQIHDELIFSVPKEELDQMIHLVEETMNHAMELKVPLKASVAYGNSWYEAK